MTTFEMSEECYVEQYLYGKKQRITRNMQFGSMVAKSLEEDEATGDPMIDLMTAKLPKLDRNDLPIECRNGVRTLFERNGNYYHIPVLKHGKEEIPLMAVPDTASNDYRAFKEDKTSVRKWTQKMADESGQITFYTTAIWLGHKFIPDDIELINMVVAYDKDGRIEPTGEIVRLKTKRTMGDVIKMTARIRKAWDRIGELCEKELL